VPPHHHHRRRLRHRLHCQRRQSFRILQCLWQRVAIRLLLIAAANMQYLQGTTLNQCHASSTCGVCISYALALSLSLSLSLSRMMPSRKNWLKLINLERPRDIVKTFTAPSTTASLFAIGAVDWSPTAARASYIACSVCRVPHAL
jgi:hypothetical protein